MHAGQPRGAMGQRGGHSADGRLTGSSSGGVGSSAAGMREGAVSSVSAVASAKVLAARTRGQVMR